MEKISFGKLKQALEARDDSGAEKRVVSIIEAVRKNGDRALIKFTEEFDGARNVSLKVPAKELAYAGKKIDREVLKVVKEAEKRIKKYHDGQIPEKFDFKEKDFSVEYIFSPVEKAGIYIPAGQSPLVSTALMTVIPAQVAGVKKIYAASPPSCKGKVHPLILGVLDYLGIKDVFAVGGAQSIAAFAYGTGTVPAVDIIAGPGNKYVNAAKRLLCGKVGIDLLAGPSELVVFSDGSGNADFIAADIEAQIEHTDGLGIVVTTSEKEGRLLSGRIKGGYILVAKNIKEAVEIINYIAPEHLQVMCRNPHLIASIVIAGAVFFGDYSPAVLGDYFAGPSHVLPTGRAARFSSGLSVYTFLRSHAVISAGAGFYGRYGKMMEVLPQAERLSCHCNSINIRRRKAAK
ncbi:MAG: histidinol dehydrogenase [Candidatus Omnitrophica bacterium]|nr:histidinol dehydrogenase [Candidatus Omnitrophota bacterium]